MSFVPRMRPLRSSNSFPRRGFAQTRTPPSPANKFTRLNQTVKKAEPIKADADKRRSRVNMMTTAVTLGTFGVLNYFLSPWILKNRMGTTSVRLTPTQFTHTKIIESTDVTPDGKIITLELPTQTDGALEPIYSVYIKDPQLQIERPYTPLYGIEQGGTLRLWVKKMPGGEVSGWLHRQSVGADIEIRGVEPTWEWKEGEWDHIVMISGGTGLTPFYQLLHHVLGGGAPEAGSHSQATEPKKHESPSTRFTLLHASPTVSSVPPELLSTLQTYANKHADRFDLRLHVDVLDDKATGLPNLTMGLIGRSAIERIFSPPAPSKSSSSWWGSGKKQQEPEAPKQPTEKTLFLISGPERMIASLAGPRARDLTDGPVAGVLGEMGYGSKQVKKL